MRSPRLLAGLLLPLLLLPAACTIDISGRSADSASPPASDASGVSPGTAPTGVPAGEVVGSGVVESERRSVTQFSRVRLRGIGRLTVDVTGSESLTVEAEDNILPLLGSEVVGGELRLGLRSGASIRTSKPIIYRLTARELDGLEVSGSASVEGRNLDSSSFEYRGSGSAEVRLTGRAALQRISISGSGSFDGEGLVGDDVTVEVSGSAGVVVHATRRLDAASSGSGDIRYVGSPATLSQAVSGSGSIAPK